MNSGNEFGLNVTGIITKISENRNGLNYTAIKFEKYRKST
jgi:hypothetical protein